MPTLLTYDIHRDNPDLHQAVRDALLAAEFQPVFIDPMSRSRVILPNTTLVHYRFLERASLDTLKSVCENLGATLERAIAVEFEQFSGIDGIPFH